MSKTEPSFMETKLGILEIKEIEWIIFDNIIQVKSYIFRNFKNMDFNIETFCLIHKLLWENLFENSWKYRLHQVQLWNFTPISRKDFTEAMKYTTKTWDFSKIIELI